MSNIYAKGVKKLLVVQNTDGYTIDIEHVKGGEIAEAAEVIGRAMSTLPVINEVFKGQGEKKSIRLVSMWRAVLERMPGEVFVAKKGGEIVGVMRFVRSPLCRVSFINDFKFLPSMLWALRGSFPRALRWVSALSAHDPSVEHWHLEALAVLPQMQGLGIGRRLMSHLCSIADGQREPVYLETDRKENVSFYEGFGFSVIKETEVFGKPVWLMWRDPGNGT